MKRNEKRLWFDKGYRQAIRDRELDSFWPTIISVWCLFAMTTWKWQVALALLIGYTVFEYMEYRDRKKYGEDEKTPSVWE